MYSEKNNFFPYYSGFLPEKSELMVFKNFQYG